MWSSSPVLRAAMLAAALAASLVLAGCTGLRPVHGDAGGPVGRSDLVAHYAEPSNRLEQIIYQDLALRLGRATGPAPTVRVSVGRSSRDLTFATVTGPGRPRQMTVTAAITVTAPDGTVLFSGTRAQTADYTSSPQALASRQAENDAAERAARLLADTVRLEVIAALRR